MTVIRTGMPEHTMSPRALFAIQPNFSDIPVDASGKMDLLRYIFT